ncbi:MAG: hypothetical protein WCX79_01835 [Candidatus Paceibacterota bacterium]|jgi:hypothetical protein
MEIIFVKATFGILSSFLVILGSLFYLKDIHKRRVCPHLISSFGWASITAIGAFAMLAEGGVWTVAIVFANTLCCLMVGGYSIYKKVGVWSTTYYDFIFLGIGILGLILWQTLDMPVIAIICAIIADLSFGMPTIFKTYKNPNTETPFIWIMYVFSGIFSLFSAQYFTFSELAYPFYLFIFDFTVLILVLKIITKPKKEEEKVR